MRARKLQIFVSSTYVDMIDLRLAAIEAILAAGHIPATMEQFVPGDETALEIIERWIDQSDAFILLLGGRYGSVEPKSGKSYVHLEYERALASNKPIYSMIMTPALLQSRIQKLGLDVADERQRQAEYQQFKAIIQTKLYAPFDDAKDIKSGIFQKLPEWAQRTDLVGWVRGDEAVAAETANELARLSAENSRLRQVASEEFDGLTFEQFVDVLNLKGAGRVFETWMDRLAATIEQVDIAKVGEYIRQLEPLTTQGLAVREDGAGSLRRFKLTDIGKRLRNKLLSMRARGIDTSTLWK